MSAHPETGPSMETLASRLSTTRLEAFSDGVFAIAITLLVLEITVGIGARDDLLQALLDQWPAYLSYLTSFAAIGVIWLLHHCPSARSPRSAGSLRPTCR